MHFLWGTFTTRDTTLATTLECVWHKLLSLDPSENWDFEYSFERSGELFKNLDDFNSLKLNIEPHQFVTIWKKNKSVIYEKKRLL